MVSFLTPLIEHPFVFLAISFPTTHKLLSAHCFDRLAYFPESLSRFKVPPNCKRSVHNRIRYTITIIFTLYCINSTINQLGAPFPVTDPTSSCVSNAIPTTSKHTL